MTQPGEDRVVVDPEELRQVGARMSGAAAMWSAAGRSLATRSLPAMPSGVEARIVEAIRRANAELQDLASELLHEAGQLSERATWAELGGISSVAWLMPTLSYLPSSMLGSSPVTGAWRSGGVGEELFRSERWAQGLLDEMSAAAGSRGDGSVGSDDFDDDRRALLLGSPLDVGTTDEGLGAVAMSAGAGLDVYEHERAGDREVADVGSAAAEGVLALPIPEGAPGVILAGLIGCLSAGGLGASSETGLTGD